MAKKRGKRKKQPAFATPSVPLDRVLFYAVLFLVFALPLFIWPGITEYGYGKTIVALIGVSVLAVLWGLSAWQKGTWSIRLPWITFPVLGFVAASLLSLLYATNGRVVVQSLVLIVFFLLLMLIIANAARDQRDVDLLLFALLASGFLVALYGMLQYLGVMRGPAGTSGLNAVISTMGNRNYLGGFLAYLLFPAVVLVVRPRSRWVKLLSVFLIAFCFGMVLIVQQTGTVAALIVAAVAFLLGWLIFRPIEPIRRNRVWLLILIGALVVTFLVEAPSGPLNSVVGLSRSDSSWIARWWERNSGSVRSWDWWIGWDMFKDHPMTGVGLGNYKLNFIPYKAEFLATPRGEAYDFYIDRAAQAHNEYVQILAELGILGVLAAASFLVVLVVSLWKRTRSNDETNRLDLLLFSCGIVAFLVHGLVSFPAHLPASSLVLVVVGGLSFSRAYGDAALRSVKLVGWKLKGTLAAVTVIGLIVSVVAVRDISANLLMSEGIEQAQIGNLHGAESLLERSLDLDFAPRQTYYHLAVVQIELGAYDEARANLERCFTRFVDETVYLNYANLATNARQFELALETIDLLLATHPREEVAVRSRYLKAVITAQVGDRLEATGLFEQLIADAPRFEAAHIGLGLVYEARGMPEEARRAFETALQVIDDKLADAQERLARQETITAEEYGRIRTEIDQLRQERSTVLEKLEGLPPAESP
jgi:O-antigen ligase/Flp pilus assembly protein TadD